MLTTKLLLIVLETNFYKRNTYFEAFVKSSKDVKKNLYNFKDLLKKTIFEYKLSTMKLAIPFLFLIAVFGCKKPTEQYTNLHLLEIQNHQKKLNDDYANPKSSPLTPEDLTSFETLDFFEVDENYEVKATLELTPNDPVFEMATTTNRKPLYKRFGIATFQLNGKQFTLNVYQNQQLILDFEHRNSLFLPFTDATNGHESYKGGRYIDVEIPLDNILAIDFNKAYNPYCAYNSKYSCPVVPKENHLDIEIKAGVKAFAHH